MNRDLQRPLVLLVGKLLERFMVGRFKRNWHTPGRVACLVILIVFLTVLIQSQSATCAALRVDHLKSQTPTLPLTVMQSAPIVPPATPPDAMPVKTDPKAPMPPEPQPGPKPEPILPGVEPPEAQHYTCPPTRYINCMPPLKEPARKWCNPEYLQWAKSHCAGIEVVY
jgi:hypothetical protein